MISLRIPSRLEYRDLAIRTVASVCKLVPRFNGSVHDAVVSAFSEALNNAILHAYAPHPSDLEIEIDLRHDRLIIRLKDYGEAFDPATAPAPDLDTLPESGLGVFIMRSFMDDISYVAGRPNVLSMTKYLKGAVER